MRSTHLWICDKINTNVHRRLGLLHKPQKRHHRRAFVLLSAHPVPTLLNGLAELRERHCRVEDLERGDIRVTILSGTQNLRGVLSALMRAWLTENAVVVFVGSGVIVERLKRYTHGVEAELLANCGKVGFVCWHRARDEQPHQQTRRVPSQRRLCAWRAPTLRRLHGRLTSRRPHRHPQSGVRHLTLARRIQSQGVVDVFVFARPYVDDDRSL